MALNTLDTSPGQTSAACSTIDEVLASDGVRSVFQPIVELASRTVSAYEALARGPVGPLESPDLLFAAARETGRLRQLDEACRRAAFRGAVRLGLVAPLTVFVNVEPEVLDAAPLADLLAEASGASGELRIVLEITERALAARPAELLRTVARVRELGWGIALDDVGADAASLAFMPLLQPDVVKLDLRLVQDRPSPDIAEIMNAVNAYAEGSGALLLAEGIETEEHLLTAQALGATLGQGWLFGRPASVVPPAGEERIRPITISPPSIESTSDTASPFACLPLGTTLTRSSKRLLIELSKHLEREAMRLGETCVVAAAFQHARHFTPSTAARYRRLVATTGFVCALGEGLGDEPVPGLRATGLEQDDPVLGEWDVVILAPHYSAALVARDLGDTGPEMERRFEYALTYQRDTAVRAARTLLSRIPPRIDGQSTAAAPAAIRPVGAAVATARSVGDGLVRRALAAATSGVTIADMTSPDQPLAYVNAAFESLAGYPASTLVGSNCRFLQDGSSDPAAVERIRAAIAAGQESRETLLNFRGPQRQPWWNEIHLSPVTDQAGAVVAYIGVQNDVTTRVEAEQALQQETERARHYLAQIEQLAYTDSLTGLMNRRRFEVCADEVLVQARLLGRAVALLFLDLDGFKAVNDSLGHAAGDELLQIVAERLRAEIGSAGLLARLGGDEFLIALPDLDRDGAAAAAGRMCDAIADAVGEPARVRGHDVPIRASTGFACYPDDADDFATLLHLADQRMYRLKHRND